MATEFHYSIQNDFPNQAVNTSVLSVQIQQSSISATLNGITVTGDDVAIMFATDLTSGEVTTLNDIIANHQGVPFNSGAQRTNAVAEQTNTTTTFSQGALLSAEPVRAGEYQVSFYCEVSVENNVDGSGCQFRLLFDGTEQATGGTDTTLYDCRSGAAVVSLNGGDAPDIALEWRRIGASNTARVRRIRLALVPLGRPGSGTGEEEE